MRFEIKYKIENLPAHLVAQAIKQHPVGFRRIYADRWINNFYFDSPEFIAFEDNVNGVSHRKKYRIRWYGNENEIVNPKLEVKIKENQLGRKEFFDLPDFSEKDLITISKAVNRLSISEGILIPALNNSYLRSYYGTTDGKFRLTVDRELRYRSLINGKKSQEDGSILELKYDKSLDGQTDRITQYFPFRQTKSSKYVTGMLMTKL